jgi:hypothetical protein
MAWAGATKRGRPRRRHPQRGGECAWPLFGVQQALAYQPGLQRGRSGSAGRPPAPPRPAPQGCTATTRWGAAGVSCCTSASSKPRMAGDTLLRAKPHRSQPRHPQQPGWGWPLAAPPRPALAGRPSGRRSGGVLALRLQRLAGAGERLTRSASAGSLAPSGSGGGSQRGGGDLARVKVEQPVGPPAPAPLRRTPPCPRPAVRFAAAKRLRPAPAPRRAQGCGDPSGWTWWSGEQWRGPPATGAFAMCNRAWRWELNAFWP